MYDETHESPDPSLDEEVFSILAKIQDAGVTALRDSEDEEPLGETSEMEGEAGERSAFRTSGGLGACRITREGSSGCYPHVTRTVCERLARRVHGEFTWQPGGTC